MQEKNTESVLIVTKPIPQKCNMVSFLAAVSLPCTVVYTFELHT